MPADAPIPVTVEEAVAYLINLDFIPSGFSLLEMTAAFQEESEVADENGADEKFPELSKDDLYLRKLTCMARHAIASYLLSALQDEVRRDSILVAPEPVEGSAVAHVDLRKVSHWAQDRFGIHIPLVVQARLERASKSTTNDWSQVTIKIQSEGKLLYRIKDGKWMRSSFSKVGLTDQRNSRTSKPGTILVGLSKGKKIPANGSPSGGDKTAMAGLRSSLRELTGMEGDPFFGINEDQGWLPRFTLIDDRRNADERAKKRAIHIPNDEVELAAPDYEDEQDAAGKWLADNGKGKS